MKRIVLKVLPVLLAIAGPHVVRAEDSVVLQDTLQLSVFYELDTSEWLPFFRDNETRVQGALDSLRSVGAVVTDVYITGLTSLDGWALKNRKLGNTRAFKTRDVLTRLAGNLLKDAEFHIVPGGEAWSGYEASVRSDARPFPASFIAIISDPGPDCESAEQTKTRAIAWHGGYAWRRAEKFYPDLRRSDIELVYQWRSHIPETPVVAPVTEDVAPTVPVEVEPVAPVVPVVPVEVEPVAPVVPVVPVEVEPVAPVVPVAPVAPVEVKPDVVKEEPVVPETPVRPWQVTVGTNLLYDLVTVANLFVQCGFANHFAVNLAATYSPWDITPTFKLRTLILKPEFKFFFAKGFKGHYLGVEGYYGWYNIALPNLKTRYQDRDGSTPAYGAGLSYGYVLPISKHFGFDFNISLGYAHFDYDCFYNVVDGAKYTTGVKDWFGPTGLGVSLYYSF